MVGRRAGGALVVLRVPELLSTAALLMILITGRSFLFYPCPVLYLQFCSIVVTDTKEKPDLVLLVLLLDVFLHHCLLNICIPILS